MGLLKSLIHAFTGSLDGGLKILGMGGGAMLILLVIIGLLFWFFVIRKRA
jgi:preprotein translocase subunit YajC